MESPDTESNRMAKALMQAKADRDTQIQVQATELKGRLVRVTYCTHSHFWKEAEAGDPKWAHTVSGTMIGVAYQLGHWNGEAPNVIVRYGNTNTYGSVSFRKVVKIEEVQLGEQVC